jgi:hypothetical protein
MCSQPDHGTHPAVSIISNWCLEQNDTYIALFLIHTRAIQHYPRRWLRPWASIVREGEWYMKNKIRDMFLEM